MERSGMLQLGGDLWESSVQRREQPYDSPFTPLSALLTAVLERRPSLPEGMDCLPFPRRRVDSDHRHANLGFSIFESALQKGAREPARARIGGRLQRQKWTQKQVLLVDPKRRTNPDL